MHRLAASLCVLLLLLASACTDLYAPTPAEASAAPAAPLLSSSAQQLHTVTAHGYTLVFYPGWLSRAELQPESGPAALIFQQSAPYEVDATQSAPDTEHTLHVSGGYTGSGLSIQLSDPGTRVQSVSLQLQHQGSSATLLLIDHPTLCPPDCGAHQ
jgi:hypothetical protein